MSDSDDDWFDKEIDDFVVNVQDKVVADEGINLVNNFMGGPSKFFDSDYGGNYNKMYDSNASSNKSNAATNSKSGDPQTKHIQAISYKKLSFILELAPLNVFLELIAPDSGFAETINRPTISYEVIALTLKAIARILQQPLIEHNRCFLKSIFDAKNYWKQIENYTKDLTSNQKSVKDKKKLIISPTSEFEFWEHLCLLCRHMVRHFKMDDTFFEKTIKYIVDSKHELKLKKFRDDLENIRATMTSKQLGKVPEIYPTLAELLSDKPVVVQPNLIKGRYEGVAEYLDVHLSLLREDFIAPLREGIAEFRTKADLGIQQSNGNVRLYPKVRILTKQKQNVRQQKGEFLMVDLDPDSRQKSDADVVLSTDSFTVHAKKLMYGSLLLFTSGVEFEDLIVAVISNREAEMLSQGYVQIEILKTSNISLIFEKDLLMFESEIYFEPYHQVHRVLSNFTEDSFPMKNYIINIDPMENFPSYVSPAPKVIYSHRKQALDLKDTSRWPDANILNMNDSQLKAFRHALTNQFSIIQGPPGTGKTHIGLEILTTLLRNTDEQMLVICSTNHALDQFLVGVLNYTEDIVRMGQQSKNELLDRFNVKLLMEDSVFDQRLKHCFYKSKCEYAELMQRFQDLQAKIESDDDRRPVEKKMLEIQERLRSITRRQEELRQINEYNVLKTKRVVGMTSSCAARCSTLLRMLKTPIVFVEEAAEMLESHIVAVLTKETQHLILIGDHQQLRPTTSVYKLAKLCHMDISLFERMINNQVHSTQLTVQHRMRPEIANLIRPHIYKELNDHESVLNYPKAIGLQKNLFFINHNHPESSDRDEFSKKNPFEVHFLFALCNYLILQGYAPQDITILTTYNGQMSLFSHERKKHPILRKVRFTVVDNYQGEENKIVLLSLVRSNLDKKIGYLSLANRVCVALSRAKECFYVIGDMDVLASSAMVWRDVRAELERQNAIGRELVLQCQTHQNTTKVDCANTLEELKYGGCREQCGKELECGHMCSSVCHTNSFKHVSNCGCPN